MKCHHCNQTIKDDKKPKGTKRLPVSERDGKWLTKDEYGNFYIDGKPVARDKLKKVWQ